jgi:hypothetical protein
MAIAGLVITILAILFSIYTYFVDDKKIKDQTKSINDDQLRKIEKVSIEEKKAILKTEIVKVKNGESELIITNEGKANAIEVDIKFSEIENLKAFNNPCPININSGSYIKINLTILLNCPNKLDLIITWKDEFSEKNFETQILQIN